ncbi:MAG: hypothetical protein ACWA5Q_09735 [bacterium]
MPLIPKLKATGTHFGISLIIFFIIVPFIYYAWYPQPYFAEAGGWQGVRILAAVDLILGPVLTFVIFNPDKAKKLLYIDYSFIALAQLIALAWGIHAIHSQRPVAVVYHGGFFEPVIAESLRIQEFNASKLTSMSDESPPLLISRKNLDAQEEASIIPWQIIHGIAQWELGFLMEPIVDNFEDLEDQKQNLTANQLEKLQHITAAREPDIQDSKVVRFLGRYGSSYLVISRNGRLIGSF